MLVGRGTISVCAGSSEGWRTTTGTKAGRGFHGAEFAIGRNLYLYYLNPAESVCISQVHIQTATSLGKKSISHVHLRALYIDGRRSAFGPLVLSLTFKAQARDYV